MKQYRLFMLLASVFLLAGLNSCSHEEFSESTLPEKGLSLSLNVISSSYAPAGVEDTGTRTSEEDYTTRFTSWRPDWHIADNNSRQWRKTI